MKKKNIITAILVTILVVTLIAGAIISNRSSSLQEDEIRNVISCFLAGDHIWDESRELVVNPRYIELYHFENDDAYFVIFPFSEEEDDEYLMFYSPKYNERADFFIKTPVSTNQIINLNLVEEIMDICMALRSGTCYLKTSDGSAVLVENIRISRNGALYALDNVSGKWHKNVATDDFILA